MAKRHGVPAGGLSFAEFWKAFVLLDVGGRLVTPVPHREQARFIEAVDAKTPAGGKRYPEYFLHWSKKTSKSFCAAARLVHHLVGDQQEPHDRRACIASFDEDQSRLIFRQCGQLVDRHPFLRRSVRVLRNEMVYTERCRDARTDGTFTREHTITALPRDLKGTHGELWSEIVRDELWTEPDAEFSESLIISPTRPHGGILYLSYFPPRAMMRPGVPVYDLLERVRHGDPSLFYSYIGGRGAEAPWKVCPWITEAWIAQQETIFATSPARFRRVILNEPAGADSGLIDGAELRDAIDDQLHEPAAGHPDHTYWVSCDLGVTSDYSCVMLGHLDGSQRLIVDVVKVWRGTPDAPVSLLEVQDYLIALHRRFRYRRIDIDQWQARSLTETLQRHGITARLVTVESTRIDRLVTALKGAFTRRLVKIPADPILVEQLESVQAIEARRRDLLRFEPSKTHGAGAHDDCVLALGMLIDMAAGSLGRLKLPPEFRACFREASGLSANCYVIGGSGLPIAGDACCTACPGRRFAESAYAAHVARTGDGLDVRTWYPLHVQPNTFISMRRADRWAAHNV